MDDALMREVFEKIDEEDRIYAELSLGSVAYDFVLGINDFQEHLSFAVVKLREVVGFIRASEDMSAALEGLKRFRFYLFAFGSTHLTLEKFLFEVAEEIGVTETVSPSLMDWKRSPPVQLIKAYRPR
jgi:hypothetical protein